MNTKYTIGRLTIIALAIILTYTLNYFVYIPALISIVILFGSWFILRTIMYYIINDIAVKKLQKENNLSYNDALELLSEKIVNNEM